MKWLEGKKTHIAAIGGVLSAIGGWLSGALTPFEALVVALNSFGLSSLRSGVKADIKKVGQ